MDITNPRDRDVLGNIVRVAWQIWAREQPDLSDHPSWIIPYADLDERAKEVNRRVGCLVYLFAMGMVGFKVDEDGGLIYG